MAAQPNSGSSTESSCSSEGQIDDLVSKLPIREGLVLYKSFWLRPQATKRIMLLQDMFKPRHDDIILATNPKCGTTWIKALNNIYKDRDINLETAFSMFSQGCSPYGPFWDHCLEEYWKESVTSPDRVLFLKYEDMMSEPVKHVTRLAEFLGVPFSNKEEEDRVPEDVVRLCSFERLSSLHNNQTGDLFKRGNIVTEKSVFFRRGKVGDWVNHMSEEMGRKLDCIMEEKLKGTGLVF